MNADDLPVALGKWTRENLYLLDQDCALTNHGSYGCVPKEIVEKRIKLQLEMESVPDRWFRITSEPLWNRSISSLAAFLDIPSDNLVLCDNATDAINAALKSISFNSTESGPNDCILAHNYTYPAILYSIEYTSKYRMAKGKEVGVVKMPLILPLRSQEQVLQEFDTYLDDIVNKRKLNLRLVVIDHISSATAILYPIREVIQLIRKWTGPTQDDPDRRCFILVDGGHLVRLTNPAWQSFEQFCLAFQELMQSARQRST